MRHDQPYVFAQEVGRARTLRLNAYRLSVEWSRLEPNGVWDDSVLTGTYVPILRALRAAGMEPVLTLHHLTNPLWVLTPPQDRMGVVGALPGSMKEDQQFRASLGGWEKPQTVDAYVAFVGRLVQRLVQVMGSDAPRWWVTLNEPIGSIVGTRYIAGICRLIL